MIHSIHVQEVMASPVISAHKSGTLTDARALMKKHSINHLPILDENNAPIGMVSALDLNRLSDWRTQFKDLTQVGEKRNEDLFDSLLIEEIMVSPVTCVRQDATVIEVADLIEQEGIHCIPIINKQGATIGVLTAHDLLRLAYGAADDSSQISNPPKVV